MQTNDKLWYKDGVFYEVYVRAYHDSNNDGHGDLEGLRRKLDYIQDLGITCIWLLPIYPSPLKDDGYDIADYYGIHPDYGTIEDFKRLIQDAHSRGIRIITDLVLNHTSDQHPWFQSARHNPNSRYFNYYVWSESNSKYADARIIFLDTEKSNWAWDDVAKKYYWHRFYSSQPDLNYDNPAVQEEMLKVMRYWLDMGVDGFRADAVPYLFERDGTNCENLPETHAYLKRLRQYLDDNYPGRILLCEANQWPKDVRPYFGNGDEFHMGFHFPLMPRIFMALRKEDITDLKKIIALTPEIPANCQWCTFLRNHDELTLEMVTEEERAWMWREYAPNPLMRLNLGIRRRLAPLLDNNQKKIEVANSLIFTLTGTPIIYYGDEIGMGDNIQLDDRNGVRTPMQWNDSPGAGFSNAPVDKFYAPLIDDKIFGYHKINVKAQRENPQSLWHTIRKMIEIHKKHKALGRGSFTWVDVNDLAIAAYQRSYHQEQILVLNNLSNQTKTISLKCTGNYHNLFSPSDVYTTKEGKIQIKLHPYQYLWLLKIQGKR